MEKGFTILELLAVICVLAIIIGIAIPRIKGITDQAYLARADKELTTLQTALESYYMLHRVYPPTSASIAATHLIHEKPQLLGSPLYDPFSLTGAEYRYISSSNGKYYIVWSIGSGGDQQPTGISDEGDIIY